MKIIFYLSLLAIIFITPIQSMASPAIKLKIIDGGHISLKWSNELKDSSGSKIYRNEKLISIVSKDTTSYIDTSVESNTTYKYYIKEFKSKKYIVSKDGNDNAIGDDKQPLKTIQKAIDYAQAGDTIYVKAGRYNERLKIKNSGKPNLPITLEAQKSSSGKRLVTIFGGDKVKAKWIKAIEISPYTYKTTDIPYHSFAMTVKKDGEIKDIPKLYAQDNEEYDTKRKYNYKDVLAYSPNRIESGPFTHLSVNYWDGIEALYAYEPKTHTTYIRFRDGDNPNNMKLYSSPGEYQYADEKFDPSNQGTAIMIKNKSHIVIKGFNIDGAQNGVSIFGKDAKNNVIEDNDITNGQRRVLLSQGTSNNIIKNNKMHMRLLSKKFRPGAWLSQHKADINNNYNDSQKKKIAVAEHYYNVYKHEVGAATGSPQDDSGINFVYAGNNNRIYKNEIYDTLGGVLGILSEGDNIYIYDNIFHHISSVTIHIPELDLGEYFIHDNKIYDVQTAIRIQLMLNYKHRKFIAKKIHFFNNTIYNPLYIGINLYIYRTEDDHDYQKDPQYHPTLEFKDNKFIGGRIILGLMTNIGSKTILIGNTFSSISMEILEEQKLKVVKDNWVNTINNSTYQFNKTNTISHIPKWNLPKIPTHIPKL